MELEDLLSCAELQFCTNSENEVRYEPSGELQAATTSNPPRLQPAPVLPTRDPTQNSSTPPPPEPPSANQPHPHKRFVPPASANQPHPHKRFVPPASANQPHPHKRFVPPASANQPHPHKRFVPPASANQPHPHKRFVPPAPANQPHPHKRFVPPASANQPHPHKRFAPPVTNEEIQRRRSDSIPLSTAADTKYCTRVWLEWSDYHAKTHNSEVPPLTSISPSQFCYWLIRFVLEVRKKDGAEYPPQTLHHLCSGLLRHLRQNGHPTLDIFKDSSFAEFRSTLDAEMKRLQHKGLGSTRRQAEPLTEEEEEVLWEKGLLGDHSPQALLNTMVYMNGVYFALRSGKEHRELRFNSSQISLIEHDGERPFLQYTEDESKNRPGGLKGCRIGRKVVKHHANISNPPRCFVRLYSLYKSRCPSTPKRNSFYLQCLKKPTDTQWFSNEPLGHNTLSKVVSSMCRAAGIAGFRTNHSLRATSATRLYAAGTEEQLIMERTGHRSIEGVRSYKRTSEQQEQSVSDTLSLSKRPKTAPPTTSSEPTPALTEITNHHPHITQATSNTMVMSASMPASFSFSSCQSIVINFNK